MARALLSALVLLAASPAHARGGEVYYFRVDLHDGTVQKATDPGTEQFSVVSPRDQRKFTFTYSKGQALLYTEVPDGGRSLGPLSAPLGDPSGVTSWSVEPEDGFAVAYREPMADGGQTDTLHAFDRQLRPLWTRPPRRVRDGYADARVVAGHDLLVAHEKDPVELIDARSGQTVRSFGPSLAISAIPLPPGDTLVEAGGALRRLGPDLADRWKVDLVGKLLAVRVLSSTPYSVGAAKWALAPLDASSDWLVKSDRELLLMNPVDGKVRWRVESRSDTLPAAAEDRVFDAVTVRSMKSASVSLRVRALETGRVIRSVPIQTYAEFFDETYVQVVTADADSVVVRVVYRVLD